MIMDFETLFLKQNQKQEKEELPLFTEYAIDFDTSEPLKNGDRLVELTGNEALKVWIFKALKTKRNLDVHIGTVYQESIKNALIISEIKDCLLVNPYILDCYNFELKYNSDDNHLRVSFNVSTVYGESEVKYIE